MQLAERAPSPQGRSELTRKIAKRVEPPSAALCAQIVDPDLDFIHRESWGLRLREGIQHRASLRSEEDTTRKLHVAIERAGAGDRVNHGPEKFQRSTSVVGNRQNSIDRNAASFGAAANNHRAR